MLPALAQPATESDSDSGMGSPAEEMVMETANNKEELPGEVTKQYIIIQPLRDRSEPSKLITLVQFRIQRTLNHKVYNKCNSQIYYLNGIPQSKILT